MAALFCRLFYVENEILFPYAEALFDIISEKIELIGDKSKLLTVIKRSPLEARLCLFAPRFLQ